MSYAQKREKTFRCINCFAALLYLLVCCYSVYYNQQRRDWYAVSQALLAIAMLPIPALVSRFTKLYVPQDARLLYACFVFGTIVIGSSFYGYGRIPYWDKIFHFLSGTLISLGGLAIYRLLSGCGAMLKGRALLTALTFSLFFNLGVAALWEMYEYSLYIFFGVDAVNTLTTGVNDTMQDMIVCGIGSLLFLFFALRYFLREKNSFIINVYVNFFDLQRSGF